MMRWQLLISLLFTALTASANQTGVTFLPVAPVVVLGDGKAAVSTSVSVTIRSDAEKSFVFQSHGLRAPDGTWIGPASVTGPQSVNCTKDAYVTVTIGIANLTRLGEYKGDVEFREATVEPGTGLVVPLRITVQGKPVLTIPTSGLSGYRAPLRIRNCPPIPLEVTVPTQFPTLFLQTPDPGSS